MPIDGTYGRLGAHKQRMKDMRSKRREKTENKSRTSRFSDPETIEEKKVDPIVLEQIKSEIRKKAQKRRKRDRVFTVVMIILSVVSAVYFTLWVIRS